MLENQEFHTNLNSDEIDWCVQNDLDPALFSQATERWGRWAENINNSISGKVVDAGFGRLLNLSQGPEERKRDEDYYSSCIAPKPDLEVSLPEEEAEEAKVAVLVEEACEAIEYGRAYILPIDFPHRVAVRLAVLISLFFPSAALDVKQVNAESSDNGHNQSCPAGTHYMIVPGLSPQTGICASSAVYEQIWELWPDYIYDPSTNQFVKPTPQNMRPLDAEVPYVVEGGKFTGRYVVYDTWGNEVGRAWPGEGYLQGSEEIITGPQGGPLNYGGFTLVPERTDEVRVPMNPSLGTDTNNNTNSNSNHPVTRGTTCSNWGITGCLDGKDTSGMSFNPGGVQQPAVGNQQPSSATQNVRSGVTSHETPANSNTTGGTSYKNDGKCSLLRADDPECTFSTMRKNWGN